MLPRTEIDIVDLASGTKVPPLGERGEIRVRGPQFVTRYRNRPEENQESFRDGWLYTGDIGRFDEDGYLYLVDRKKELILVGGYNVYPREVDEVLNAHPAVMEAATIGVPDAFHGEAVKDCVALNPGAASSEEELRNHCREHLVKYKVPSVIEFHQELSKTGPARIDKLKPKGRRWRRSGVVRYSRPLFIPHATWRHPRVTLRYRSVAELLAERGAGSPTRRSGGGC